MINTPQRNHIKLPANLPKHCAKKQEALAVKCRRLGIGVVVAAEFFGTTTSIERPIIPKPLPFLDYRRCSRFPKFHFYSPLTCAEQSF
jgi:hypothetical protein